ncbi:putative RNA polymerase sigma factor FecI [compost metagenome]
MKTFLTSGELQTVYFTARDDLERMLRRRVRDKDLAADLIQETFLKLGQITAPLPDREQARLYLFRMARNLATDHQRKEARRSDILAGSQVLFEDHKPSPEDATLARNQLEEIEKALDELPRHCRSVLIMSRLHGMTHSQIATELKVSKSLVEKYAVKAMLHCRARLEASSLG